MSDEGYIQEYPCNCQGDGHSTCWIVRHPKLNPAISFPTKEEAKRELMKVRAQEGAYVTR